MEGSWGCRRGVGKNGAQTFEETAPLLRSSVAADPESSSQPSSSSAELGGLEPPSVDVRVYWWRWVVLLIFVLDLATSNAFWITFGPVEDVMRCYYNVSNFWINSLAMVYMAVYIVFLAPCAWFLNRFGLRTAAVLGMCMSAIGASIRLAGTGPQRFWLLLAGQTIAAFCNCFIWGAPSLVSVMWFPPSERATATAFAGAVAPQLGILVSFALSPVLVHSPDTIAVCDDSDSSDVSTETSFDYKYNEWRETIYWQLFWYLLGQAIVSISMLSATLFAFPEAPPTPPSLSRQLEVENSTSGDVDTTTFRRSVVKTLKNGYFVLFLITSGINIGAASAVVSLLNEVVHPYFPGCDEEVGYLGIMTISASFLAMIVVGRLLDWTSAYYALNLTVYIAATVCLAVFSVSLQYQSHFWVLYITVGALGATVYSFQALCYEYAAEMTYPLPEGTSAGLINLFSQMVSIVMIVVVGQVAGSTRTVPIGNWFITGLTALGALLSVFIMPELRRLKLDKARNTKIKSLNIQDSSSSNAKIKA